MTVGIVGLGLIGGSFAKIYHREGARVLVHDIDPVTENFVIMSGTGDGVLDESNISECDLVLVAVNPGAAVQYIKSMAPHIGSKPVVVDCCGTKRVICRELFPLAKDYGFTYLGGHPMAGNHNSGFKYARENLFRGAPMVIVLPVYDDIALLDRVKQMLSPAEFGRITVTTAEEHDEVVAFTSQLAHVVSNAYIKSPTAAIHKGYSAGSYKDLTRVAWLNVPMWAELFLENKEYLMKELSGLVESLQAYQTAMAQDDLPTLVQLLEEGKRRKEEVDGR